MPHDRNNEILKEGDIVYVPCIIKSISMNEEYCNATLETVHFMPPKTYPDTIVINTRQTIKVE